MRRLIWVFAGHTYHIVGNLIHWLKLFFISMPSYCKTVLIQFGPDLDPNCMLRLSADDDGVQPKSKIIISVNQFWSRSGPTFVRLDLGPKFILRLSASDNNSQNVNYVQFQTVSIQIRPERLLRLSTDDNGKQRNCCYHFLILVSCPFLFKCLYSLLFGLREKISSGNKILPLYKTGR